MLRRYEIKLTGKQPLLMHSDDIEWSDAMDLWRVDKDHKATSKAGDDRSPAWRWIGALYHDGEHIVVPTANIMRCLMQSGAMVLTGKGQKTFKSQTQSGIMPTQIGWPLLIDKKPLPYAPLKKLIGQKDFAKHKEAALAMGFELFLKRATIGKSKHVRVRPKFDKWAALGDLVVTDEQITTPVLADIFECGGRYKGLGDWRPGGKTPGSFGMFDAEVIEVE